MRLGKDETAQQASGVSRRQFAAMGVATAVAAGYTGKAHAALPVLETEASVTTCDGVATVRYVHPAEGQHPGLVLWTDTKGLRSSAMTVARELASAGFAVALVDPCYRAGAAAGHDARVAQLREEHVTRDSKDLSAWLDRQDQVASAKDGYIVRAMRPSMSVLTPLGQGHGNRASYLVAMPRDKQALNDRQLAALDNAIHATHRLTGIEGLAA